MHEISLVQGLFQQLADLAEQNQATKVITVTMQIGPLSGVVIDSFRFGFEVLAAENEMMKDAVLEIETSFVSYRCTKCNSVQETSGERPDKCNTCDEIFLLAEGGDELILQRVEME